MTDSTPETAEPAVVEVPDPAVQAVQHFSEEEFPTDGPRIELDRFSGPFEVLLYLIKSQEIDIFDIPIVKVTEQYLRFIEMMREQNLDLAGEFLVMAATLIQIKSKMILPIEVEEDEEEELEEEDPRLDLVEKLLEYRKFRDLADALADRADIAQDCFVRRAKPKIEVVDDDEEVDLEVGLYDLTKAIRSILRFLTEKAAHEVLGEGASVDEKISLIETLLEEGDTVEWRQLREQCENRVELVCCLLAILELCRMRRIRAHQHETYGNIRIFARDPNDIGAPPTIPVDSTEEESVDSEGEKETVELAVGEPVVASQPVMNRSEDDADIAEANVSDDFSGDEENGGEDEDLEDEDEYDDDDDEDEYDDDDNDDDVDEDEYDDEDEDEDDDDVDENEYDDEDEYEEEDDDDDEDDEYDNDEEDDGEDIDDDNGEDGPEDDDEKEGESLSPVREGVGVSGEGIESKKSEAQRAEDTSSARRWIVNISSALADRIRRLLSKRLLPFFGARKADDLGPWGESVAARHLRREGYKILDRNVYLGRNEIDIIARDEDTIVFVEVRTRSSKDAIPPEDSINEAKMRHLRNAARVYISRHGQANSYYRFDAVSVIRSQTGRPELRHFRDAFH